jgi:preprotein translocase subunit SecA
MIETSYSELRPELENQGFNGAPLFEPSAQANVNFGAAPVLAFGDTATDTLARNSSDPQSWGKVGRNELCPCGSGKKFKHCHGVLA